MAGSPYYVAPEVLEEDYTFKCDIWSIGVITYILLCGFPPFDGGNDFEIMNSVATAAVEFPSPEWDSISAGAKDFVRSLLQRNPDERPTAAEAMKHLWIISNMIPPNLPKPELIRKKSSSTILRFDGEQRFAFQKFLSNIKYRKQLGTILLSLTSDEKAHLGTIFEHVDRDKDGKISLKDLDDAVEGGTFYFVQCCMLCCVYIAV
jgi:calcium-dependent protein kinase